MEKTKFKNKFKLISTSDKKRIKGGTYNNNNDGNDSGTSTSTGGVPIYKPGNDDRDD